MGPKEMRPSCDPGVNGGGRRRWEAYQKHDAILLAGAVSKPAMADEHAL